MNTNINSNEIKDLLNKISNKDITIGIIGIGYVGLPLAFEFAKNKVKAIGFDVDEKKVRELNSGNNYIEDLDSGKVRKLVESGFLRATLDFSELANCDVIFICVPTPFTENKDPDISYIIDAAEVISKYIKKHQIIVLKSTTFPGTTEKFVKPILERNGMIAGTDFFLAFSPERIDPGNKKWTTNNTPIIVGGITPDCTNLACEVIRLAIETVVPASSPAIAEMEKLLENIFRSVNIALVNEMAQLCDRIGINIWEVIEAASTKPFGFMPFYPGPGIGGHCILIDPYYLEWMAREYDFVTDFIKLAAEINEDMPYYVTSMVIKEIAKMPVVLKDAQVLLLGMAFKRDVNDIRHSPALKIAEILIKEGIENISYYDPYIPEITINSKIFKSESNFTPKLFKNFDITVITTDHSVFDFNMAAKNSKIIIDTRNACKNVKERSNIVLLGDGK